MCNMALPENTTVRVTDEDDDMHGKAVAVYNTAGDTDQSGDTIPDGWVEVVWEPELCNLQFELYREENLEICGC